VNTGVVEGCRRHVRLAARVWMAPEIHAELFARVYEGHPGTRFRTQLTYKAPKPLHKVPSNLLKEQHKNQLSICQR
jgi:hypothetical protein